MLTVEPAVTISPSDRPGAVGRRQTGERAAEWVEMAGLT